MTTQALSALELSDDHRRLLNDFRVTGFQLLSPQSPEIVNELTRAGYLKWHWNGGIPVYEVTEAGIRALSTGKDSNE